MKTAKISILVLLLLTLLACNRHPRKNVNEDNPLLKEQPTKESIDKKKTKNEVQRIKACDSLVTNILITSSRYKQLTKGLNKAIIKNGGQSFGVRLEGSPNPIKNQSWGYSKTYDFTVYEIYTDRQLNIARFSFDPKSNLLYEYDTDLDQLKPIEFDRNLLSDLEKISK